MSVGEGSVTCEEDGKWSAQNAFCVMTCSDPKIPEHSVPLVESNCIGSKRTFLPGASCKFRCELGYRVKDRDDPGRRILKKRCTKSGRWTQPTCEPIICPALTANLLMWYNCSDANAMGSVCTNDCPGEEVWDKFLVLSYRQLLFFFWICLFSCWLKKSRAVAREETISTYQALIITNQTNIGLQRFSRSKRNVPL